MLHPENLRAVFEQVSFAEVDTLDIRNQTTNEAASYQMQNADGTFSGLVGVKPGRNTLEVRVRASDGTEVRRNVVVNFLADGPVQELNPRDLAMRNRLMENRLLDLKQRRLKIETERDDQLREDLKQEIERERAKARKRAAEQRKQLEIQVEE